MMRALSRLREPAFSLSQGARIALRASAMFSKMCGATPRAASAGPSLARKKPLVV